MSGGGRWPLFTHFDEHGASRMVDVGAKPATERRAVARGWVVMLPTTLEAITDRRMSKGDVSEVARLAGIMAAKRTQELIPLCHQVALSSVRVELTPDGPDRLQIVAEVAALGPTGVEMEALTAVSVAALTVYDMCKGVDRRMQIGPIQLEEKSGGRSGHFVRSSETPAAEDTAETTPDSKETS